MKCIPYFVLCFRGRLLKAKPLVCPTNFFAILQIGKDYESF